MTIDSRSDQELIALYRGGDDRAFEELFRRHKSRIYVAIYLIVKDRYVAEDLLQDVFVKTVDWIKGRRYNEEGKFVSWVHRMAHNMAIDYFRRRKRDSEVVVENGSRVLEVAQSVGNASGSGQLTEEGGELLRSFIKALPTEQRHVLIMRHYFQMNFKEIAHRTGVSLNTALGRMRYALINLRKKIKEKNIVYDSDFYSR